MDYTEFIVDRAQHMRPLEYDLSDNFNELVRYLHDMGVLDNVPVATLGPAEILTASDALSAPLRSLVIGGSSVQDGTPTPDAPVPIVSTVNPIIHAGDGTTDATGWPVTLPVTLRSLPDSTRDAATYTYLRPSSREGWAWYSGEVTRRTGVTTIGELTGWATPTISGHTIFRAYRPSGHDNTSGAAFCSAFGVVTAGPSNMPDNSINVNSGYWSAGHHLAIRCDSCATVADLLELVGNAPLIYALATPTTTQLDPIELPVLPAPDCTVWATADATPTLTAEYIRNLSVSISDMQASIADIISG